MAANPEPYNFSDLLTLGRSELRVELVRVIEQLCTAHEQFAYIKATSTYKDEILELQGHRDALIEEKWLILKLMEDAG